MPKPHTYHQGDVNFIPLAAFNKKLTVNRSEPLRDHPARLLIQEGEITGHHHGVWFMPQPTMFRDDALARGLAAETKTVITARLFRDDELVANLALPRGAPVIGFLVADVDVVIRHASESGVPTNEHADITLPAGEYLVTGKREWTANDERMVRD